MARAELSEFLFVHNITFTTTFVPWSISRNAKRDPKMSDYSLNFVVKMHKGSKEIHSFDYQMGIGHCKRVLVNPRIAECEGRLPTNKPDPVDLLACIANDSTAINEGSFEDWASSLGYDADSRSAEKIYNTCIAVAVMIRAKLGHEALEELQEAVQDY